MKPIIPIAIALFSVGCSFEASTKLEIDTGNDTETGAQDTGSTSIEVTDNDEDGFSVEAGDCDDDNSSVYPGAVDVCDGLDNDCDLETDEDAAADDQWEPNDDTAYELGKIHEDESYAVSGFLHNDDDLDKFRFTLEDGWEDFKVTATLSNIPSDSTYMITFERIDSGDEEAPGHMSQEFGSGEVSVEFLDSFDFSDQSGTYEVWVESISGADCGRSYLLSIEYTY
jgi:hypothetical protein